MALVNVEDDAWASELSNLERLGQQIQKLITERDDQNSKSGEQRNYVLANILICKPCRYIEKCRIKMNHFYMNRSMNHTLKEFKLLHLFTQTH